MRATSRSRLGAALLAAGLVLAACGSGDGAEQPSAAPAPTATEAAAPGTTAAPAGSAAADGGSSSGEAAALDACSLLTEDEAAEALGGPVISQGPATGVGESTCAWETEGDWSVSLSVGSPGTAAGGTFEPNAVLSEPEPVADLTAGWYVGMGMIEFAAGERLNTVQVVSLAKMGPDVEAATRLAQLVEQRIEAAS